MPLSLPGVAMGNPLTSQSFLQRRLQYLLLLRGLAVTAQLVALLLMARVFELALPWLPVGLIISTLMVYTGFTWYRARHSAAADDAAIFRQLLVDVAALSALVYFTGGSVNPFITLFLLPITFAAATLRPYFAWPIALVAISAYTLLMFFNRPLMEAVHQHGEGFSLHLWGMWYGFIISAALLVYFIGRVGHALRERDRLLAAAREDALRADQLIAMGTLATGTAHELGTPLATMAVLVHDMETEQHNNTEMHDNLLCLREQIDRCKNVLARLAVNTGQLQADSGQRLPVDQYLDEVIAEWRELRTDIGIDVDWAGESPAPVIIADRTLTQALMNVLNNSADAGAEQVSLLVDWTDDSLRLTVIDDGSGLEREARAHAGAIPYSSKPAGEGLGLGLFLARVTLQRFGGRLEIDNHAGGGTRVDIELPLKPILAAT
ncbi:MAG: ATP-binding protein [Gammaproteobacteria bacterium]|nr:ATP-binding protein [Gammaproteobacteria bacterium]